MDEYSVVIDIEDLMDPEPDPFAFDYLEGSYPRAKIPWGQISDWMRARAELSKDEQKK